MGFRHKVTTRARWLPPVFWSLSLTAERVCMYIGWLAIIALQTAFYLAVGLTIFGIFPIACIAIGGLTYPIFSEQNTILDWSADVGNAVETAFNLFQSIVKDLLDCKESLVELWETWVTLILGVVSRVYKAIKNVVAPALPDIFTWTRQAYRTERELRELEMEHNLREMLDQFEIRMREELPRISPEMRQPYLDMMRGYLYELAKAKSGVRQSPRITILPTELCDVITGAMDFFIGFLDIFGDFFLALLDGLIALFDLNTGVFSESFIAALVQLLIVDILVQLPFTPCFIDPNSLTSGSPGDILDAFRAQVVKRLLSCLCAFRYQNPGIMDPFLSPLPGGDPVPDNPGVAIAGCLCFNPTISLAGATDPIDVLIKCLGIDVLISAFQSFISTLQDTFVPLFNNLQNAFNNLQGLYYALQSAFYDLLDFANFLDDLLRRRRRRAAPDTEGSEPVDVGEAKRERANAHSAKRAGWAAELERLTNATLFRNRIIDEFILQMSNQTYVQERLSNPQTRALHTLMKPATITVGALLNQMRLNGETIRRNMTSSETRDKTRGLMARLIERLPEDSRFTKWYEAFAQRYGNDTQPHVQTIHRAVTSLSVVAASHLRANYHQFELGQRLDDVDFEGLVRAVFALSPIVRARRAPDQHAGLRKVEAASKLWIGAQLGSESLHRVADALIAKYGANDNGTRQGVIYASIAMRGHADIAEIMERFNVTEADLGDIAREARTKKEEVRTQNVERMSRLFLLENHIREEWMIFSEDVADAYQMGEDGHTGKRIIAVAIAIGIGGAASAVSIAGFAVGIGLSFGMTIVVGLFAPLLAALVAFFPFLLNLFLHAAVGIAINTMPNSPDRPNAWDAGITSYIKAGTTVIVQSYFFGWNLPTLQNLMSEWSDITVDSLQYLVGYTFHEMSGKFPLPLGRWINAPPPPVDEDGRIIIGLDTYFLEMILFCPYKEPCYDDAPYGIPCVCPGTPSRLGTVRPPAPCETPGYRRCWPYIQFRVNLDPVDVQVQLEGKCDELDGFSFPDVRPWDLPVFNQNGYNRTWFLSSEFRMFLLTLLGVALVRLRFLVRLLFYGFTIKWTGVFITFAGALWIIPTLPLQLIAVATVYSNAILGPVREAGLWTINTMDRNQDLIIMGPVATETLRWIRFDNYQTIPPFGAPTARDWACGLLGGPPLLIGIGVAMLTFLVISSFILNLSWLWAVGVFIDFVLLPINLLVFTLQVLIINMALYRNRIYLERSGPAALARIGAGFDENDRKRRSGTRKAVFRRTIGAHIVGSDEALLGVQTATRFPMVHHDCAPVYTIGSDLMIYRRAPETALPFSVVGCRPEPEHWLWTEARVVLRALHSTLMAVPTIMTRGWADALDHGMFSVRNVARWGSARDSFHGDAHHWVVLDKHVPHTERSVFPVEHYLFGPSGANILDHENVVVADPDAFHMRLPYEDLAVYENAYGQLV